MLVNSICYEDATQQPPDFLNAALTAFTAGYTPIPIRPGTKRTALKWDRWTQHISPRNIRRYWKQHPDHEVGILLTNDIIVYDADTAEGVAALYALEASLGLTPNLIVGTSRGEHHYYRRAKGTKAKSDAPDKNNQPERIDTKTGRALIIIPPSTGKKYFRNEAASVADLTEINQTQMDAIRRHNGRDARVDQPLCIKPKLCSVPSNSDVFYRISEVRSLLNYLDPNMGYDDWLTVIMAIFYASSGSDEGLALANDWSSHGTKYNGPDEIEAKWNSLDIDCPNPVTVASLYQLVKQALGEDEYRKIQSSLGPQWDLRGGDTVVTSAIETRSEDENKSTTHENPLAKFSLMGMSGQLKADAFNHNLILGKIAIQGQLTVIFAKPNTGKTLVLFKLITDAIQQNVIDPRHLFYINADDGYSGVTTKAGIADDLGFHLLAPGHNDFRAKDFLDILKQIAATGHAPDTIIVLDTLKKFMDLMSKAEGTKFGIAIREFTAMGGTVITLAHTNKNRDVQGKLVPGGTSDIEDDADCSYIIDILVDKDDLRTVEFENRKNRGDVAKKVIFQYSTAEGLTYTKLLHSVVEVDPAAQDELLKNLEMDLSGDSTLIALVKGFIAQGINTKTALVDELAKVGGVSKNRARKLIEQYTGTDPITHRWNFTVGARGVQTYSMLSVTVPDLASVPAPAPAPDLPPTPTVPGTSEEGSFQ